MSRSAPLSDLFKNKKNSCPSFSPVCCKKRSRKCACNYPSNILYVSQSWSEGKDEVRFFTTIQAAINRAAFLFGNAPRSSFALRKSRIKDLEKKKEKRKEEKEIKNSNLEGKKDPEIEIKNTPLKAIKVEQIRNFRYTLQKLNFSSLSQNVSIPNFITIYIYPGTYTENLVFTENIMIQGTDVNQVFVVGSHTWNPTGSQQFQILNFKDIYSAQNNNFTGTTLQLNSTFTESSSIVQVNFENAFFVGVTAKLKPSDSILGNLGTEIVALDISNGSAYFQNTFLAGGVNTPAFKISNSSQVSVYNSVFFPGTLNTSIEGTGPSSFLSINNSYIAGTITANLQFQLQMFNFQLDGSINVLTGSSLVARNGSFLSVQTDSLSTSDILWNQFSNLTGFGSVNRSFTLLPNVSFLNGTTTFVFLPFTSNYITTNYLVSLIPLTSVTTPPIVFNKTVSSFDCTVQAGSYDIFVTQF